MKLFTKKFCLVLMVFSMLVLQIELSAESNVDENYTKAEYISIKLPDDETIYPLFMYDTPLVEKKTMKCLAANTTLYRILGIAASGYRIIPHTIHGKISNKVVDLPLNQKSFAYNTGSGVEGAIWEGMVSGVNTKRYTYSLDGEGKNAKAIPFNNRAMLSIEDVLDFFEVPYEQVVFDAEKNNVVICLSASDRLVDKSVEIKNSEDELIGKAWQNATSTKGISVSLNGEDLEFDVPPMMVGDRVLVPMRKIFEALGASVDWDEESQTVTAVKGDKIIKLTIGNAVISVNGVETEIDAVPQLTDGRTMVPVRVISESLGAIVSWNPAFQKVIIFYIQPVPSLYGEEYGEIEKMFFNEINATLKELNIDPVDEYLLYNDDKDESLLCDYSFSVGISKEDFEKFSPEETKNTLKLSIESVYAELNKKYPDKKFQGYFHVDGYKTFFLSWRNYKETFSPSQTYSNTAVETFEWDFNGDSYGDGTEMVFAD